MTEYNTISGSLDGADQRIGIVAARFNQLIVDSLVNGAVGMLGQLGVAPADITVAWVPGAYELPLAARRMAESGQYDGIIALGTVIRGSTPHFDYVCGECASGLSRVQSDLGLPVAFGVLTTETTEQATERAGTKMGNKGADSAMAVLEMINLLPQLDSE